MHEIDPQVFEAAQGRNKARRRHSDRFESAAGQQATHSVLQRLFWRQRRHSHVTADWQFGKKGKMM
jgi:hypothetical protein